MRACVCIRVSGKRVLDKESRDLNYLSTSAVSSLLLEEMPSTSNLKKQKTKHLLDFIRSPGPQEKINENANMFVQLP